MIFISGPTGAGKTQTIKIAAAIAGDSVRSVQWTGNQERLCQAVVGAKEEGSFLAFDEVIKNAVNRGRNITSAMEFLLNLTPETLGHRMYHGPMNLGSLPVICLTDTSLPDEVKEHAQLARRIVHVELNRRVDWEPSLQAAGLSSFYHLRLADPRYCDAANAILSYIIDEFFDMQRTFREISEALGFRSLERSAEAEDKRDRLRRFFVHVCKALPIDAMDAIRWKGRGWKIIDRGKGGLNELWKDLHNEDDFTKSRACEEPEWRDILGVEPDVRFEVKGHGQSRVAVRFIARNSRVDYAVNEELFQDARLPDELDAGPEQDSVSRS